MTTNQPAPRPFHWRAFVTFAVIIIFLVIALTGIVLFITPPGRIANWSGWRFLGFSKAQWQTVHTVFSLLFVITATVHLYFNWRVIVGYMMRRLRDGIHKRREVSAALTAAVIILVMAADGMAPFGTLMAWGEELKNGWSTSATEPPVPHTASDPGPGYGRKTVGMICKESGVDTDRAIARLASAGITADRESPIRSLSSAAGKTPIEIVGIIRGQTTEQEQ